MTHCAMNAEGCPAGPAAGRHRHRSTELNNTGDTCSCGATDWYLQFGGLMPTLLQCGACSHSVNLTERMRVRPEVRLRKHGVR